MRFTTRILACLLMFGIPAAAVEAGGRFSFGVNVPIGGGYSYPPPVYYQNPYYYQPYYGPFYPQYGPNYYYAGPSASFGYRAGGGGGGRGHWSQHSTFHSHGVRR